MTIEFQPGDVVRLNAPKMTVESVTFGEDVHCVWFEGEVLHRGSFHISTLDRVAGGEHVRFISEEEDSNPSGLETSRVADHLEQDERRRASFAAGVAGDREAFGLPKA